MDKPLAIYDKKTTKPKHRQNPQKSKKKQQEEATNAPVKVVYIANPVNFSTSASEFRSLVQQLTGKQAYSSDNSVGGSQLHHQQSLVVDASIEINVPESTVNAVAHDHEAEDIASSSSLNCTTTTSDHNSNLLDIGHRAVNDDDVYNMPDPMLDNYLPLDFWYDQY